MITRQQKKVFLAALVATCVGVSATAQTVKFKDCIKTRLGCLDENQSPILPVPTIQIGLQLQITCNATDAAGQDYLINVKQIKNVEVKDGSIVNYYLSEGQHGAMQYSIQKMNATSLESNVADGYYFSSQATQHLEVGNNTVTLKSIGNRSTRGGQYTESTELVFSDVAVNKVTNSIVPQFKIYAVLDLTKFYNDMNGKSEETAIDLKFETSNCAYN